MYFQSRKGEVNELRQLLRTFSTERDKQRKRDIIKKVIGYMTLGIDVSRLFTEMILAIESEFKFCCIAVEYCCFSHTISSAHDISLLELSPHTNTITSNLNWHPT